MTQLPMKLAYADPPYLGMGKLYAAHHSEAMVWNDPTAHFDLIERLDRDYPDGWAMSASVPSLEVLLPSVRVGGGGGYRIGAWVKPFAAFKRNVRVAYTWEPVIVRGGRLSSKDGALPTRDHLAEPITLKKGLPGAKPERFCRWVLDLLGFVPGDTVDDIFPGTGVMGRVVAAATASPLVLRDRAGWIEPKG